MTASLYALANAAILSLPLTAAVWLALRLIPRPALSASARYVVWWIALASVIALPLIHAPHPARALPMGHGGSGFVGEILASPPPAHTFPVEVPSGAWVRWLLTTWVVLTLLLLARLAASLLSLLGRKRAALAVESPFPLPRNARLKLSREISTPAAAGFLAPAILLPSDFPEHLDRGQVACIVLHESAHLARRDDYALLVQRGIECAFALHPAVRFIASELDLEREIACDERVIASTGEPARYAASLTRVAEICGRAPFPAAAFSGSGSQLSRRIDMLLDRTLPRFSKTRTTLAAATLMVSAVVLARTPPLLASPARAPQAQFPSRIPPAPAAPVVVDPAKPKPAPRLVAQAALPPPAPPDIPTVRIHHLSIQVTDTSGNPIDTHLRFQITQTAPAPAAQNAPAQEGSPAPQPEPAPGFAVLRVQAGGQDGLVPALTRDDFTIFEDGAVQNIVVVPDGELYLIGYISQPRKDGRYAHIKVSVDRPGLSVFWYYPEPPAHTIGHACDTVRKALGLPDTARCL